ncbi:ABC transporter substrate-binding protein [Candidatus Acetothermia bacterium]|nr:ABC transporter substrate-binding protein [Candidatus Acetothermia bacterium]
MKNRIVKIISIVMALSLILTLVVGYAHAGEPTVGHIHMTDSGGFRDTMVAFVREQFATPVTLFATGSAVLRRYLGRVLEIGRIMRGTLFSYNHREVHRQFEMARPFIAELPGRFPVREELAKLADPRGELHLVWVNAYVIIYNPALIARADVPSTMEALANFDRIIGVPTTGCIGTWGTMALFYHLGAENFTRLMAIAAVRGSQGHVTEAVKNGTVAVGISTLQDVRVRDGKVGVIWPEEGAIAKPGLLVIPDNPTEYHLRLADIIMSPEGAELFARVFNKASALPGGPAPAIVEENNFNFVFIPAQAIICLELEAKVDWIVAR